MAFDGREFQKLLETLINKYIKKGLQKAAGVSWTCLQRYLQVKQ